jgi:3-oxoacyl-[acyl-carrier protein] reductase
MSYNKTAVITGAYGGLGKSLVSQYLKQGYNVHMIGRNKSRLLEIEKHLKILHSAATIKSYECDLADCHWVKDVCGMIKMETNSIDVLINCAAIFPVGSVSDTSIRSFERCMQINVTAPFVIIQQLLDHIKRSENGKVINIASSSAYGGGPNTSAYCASKHALLGLSRSLFKELKSDGVKVFCVSPGSIQTDMGKEVEKLGQVYETFMTPEEVSEYIFTATSFDGHMISEEIRLNRMFVQ